jgi:hypothetical protein
MTEQDPQPHAATAGPPTWKLVSFLGLAVFVTAGVALTLYGAMLAYQYRSGTATTATIDHCVMAIEVDGRPGPEKCYVKWNVGGAAQTGRLLGKIDGSHATGAPLDVRVRGDRAYTKGYANPNSYLLMAGGVVAVVTGLALRWFARRRYRHR